MSTNPKLFVITAFLVVLTVIFLMLPEKTVIKKSNTEVNKPISTSKNMSPGA